MDVWLGFLSLPRQENDFSHPPYKSSRIEKRTPGLRLWHCGTLLITNTNLVRHDRRKQPLTVEAPPSYLEMAFANETRLASSPDSIHGRDIITRTDIRFTDSWESRQPKDRTGQNKIELLI